MPIAGSDIKTKFSVKTGAAGNSTAGTAAGSLGKYISTTEITDNVLHNLFDLITGDENAASEAEYRCFFIHNAHGSLAFQNVKVYVLSQVAGGAGVAIGVDPAAASLIGSAGAQAAEVVDENTAPAGVVFSTPVDIGTAIAIGTIDAGKCRAVWVRRTAANTAALSNDGCVLRIQGESL